MTQNILDTVGTTKKWKSSGGDGVLTFTSVANAAGRLGDRVDLGAILAGGPSARATWFRWYAKSKFQATGLVVNNTLDHYLARWHDDTTPGDPDGGTNVVASDAAFATQNFLKNLKYIGSSIVDSTAGATIFTGSGLVLIQHRYVSPIWWNATGATASATATDFEFWLTPVNPQNQ